MKNFIKLIVSFFLMAITFIKGRLKLMAKTFAATFSVRKNRLSFIHSIILMVITTLIISSVFGINPLILLAILFLLGSLPLPKGVLMFTFVNVDWTEGVTNMGGIKTTIYYAPIADILNFPELPANPATPEDEVTLESVTGFTFNTGKNFLTIYATMETAQVQDEPQGEMDGMSFVHKATLFHPGTKAEALAFAKQVNNANMVFIFPEADGGNFRVIGSAAYPAKAKVTIDTGKATADRKGMTIEITSYGATPAPLYTGAISLTPAA